MSKDFKENINGDSMAWLDCPTCGWSGEIAYQTKPPTYCSNACKQKAARQRKKRREAALPFAEILDSRLGLNAATHEEVRAIAFHFRALAEREESHRDGSFTREDHRQRHNIAAWLLYDLWSYLYDLAEEKEKTAVTGR